jgi:hypothetical protein
MSWPVPKVADLANFSGQPREQYGPFATQALAQATFLFRMITELVQPPADPDDYTLAYNGILAMADHLYLSQPYREIEAAPIQDGSMGSAHWAKPVSYVRGSAAANALKGEQTGIMWYDLAVQTLSLRTRRGGVFHGGVSLMERVDENQLVVDENGNYYILGPGDLNNTPTFFDINSDSYPGGQGINPSM